GDQIGDFLFLDDLPVHEFFDVRVIEIEDDHLGGAAGGAAGLDGAGGAVADLEETHEAGRFAAAGKRFAFAAEGREVRTGAGTVFENAGLADPQIHDAALVHQVVGHFLNEAGVRGRAFVGGTGTGHVAGDRVHIVVPLRRPFDAVGPVQAGVEPLRAVGGRHLLGEHVAGFVVEGAGVGFGGEVAALPTPIGPAAGEALEHLA